jgi:hypothetical protein
VRHDGKRTGDVARVRPNETDDRSHNDECDHRGQPVQNPPFGDDLSLLPGSSAPRRVGARQWQPAHSWGGGCSHPRPIVEAQFFAPCAGWIAEHVARARFVPHSNPSGHTRESRLGHQLSLLSARREGRRS